LDVTATGKRYAVRSSANVEDGGAISYAGQFTSVLGVTGPEGVAQAIEVVRASSNSEGVAAYQLHQGDSRPIEMAVIVQEMINPVVSGVTFSKNPITGMSEIVVEAVEGPGDLLQAEGITPQRWVHRWGDIIAAPEEPLVSEEVLETIVSKVAAIAAEYGLPVDAEWVFDGNTVWWVQVRPITGIDDVTVYSRRIAKEVLPGLINPLVWSINVPMVNQAWLDLLERAVGGLDMEPTDLAKQFGYRAYFNMSAFGDVFAALGMPRESLELLLGLPAGTDQPRFKPSTTTFMKTPRMLNLVYTHVGYGKHVDKEVPRLAEIYDSFASKQLRSMSDAELLDDLTELRRIGVRAASLNVVTPLLANVFETLLRRQYKAIGGDDKVHAAAAYENPFDPNPRLDELHRLIVDLGPDAKRSIEEVGYNALPSGLMEEFDRFLDEFGHFSDSGNDFSVPPWRETPDTLVRVAAARTPVERSVSSVDPVRTPLWRVPGIRYLKRKSAEYAVRREAVSSMYTYGYGLFRPRVLELGRRLTERGIIATPTDVMYLSAEEMTDSVLHGADRLDLVTRRRAEMEAASDIDMPDLVFGDDFIPSRPPVSDSSVWHGTPTMRGHHRGPARVVGGISDFAKVQNGDVIVIPFSDVGWTPLFAKAGAVVAESGGMLSHSSIVAREYGLPCVVSVAGAMTIPDGATIVVDGYRGTITLEDEE
jgi:pyruvate,water dikinase